MPNAILLTAVILAFLLGFSTAFAGKIQYNYDAAGRLVAEDYGAGKVASYTYDDNGNLLNNATVIATNADVRISSMSSISPGANAGSAVTYNITVNNSGPHPAPGVGLTDPLPFGILLTGAGSSQGTSVVSGRTVTCNIGVLLPGASATVTIEGIRALEGTFTNTAFVTSDIADPNLLNNTRSITVSAIAPFDADSDGMPNWWEQRNGLLFSGGAGSFGDNGADGDPDLDGVRNFDEWMADTNPRDGNSRFDLVAPIYEAGPGLFSLRFQSSMVRRYVLEFTPGLDQPFAPVETVDGTGGEITLSHTPAEAGGFYRVKVLIPAH